MPIDFILNRYCHQLQIKIQIRICVLLYIWSFLLLYRLQVDIQTIKKILRTIRIFGLDSLAEDLVFSDFDNSKSSIGYT